MKVPAGSLFHTYSIVARDPHNGQLGVAVQTHQPGVGRAVPWLLAGVGAIATQAWANLHFGPMGLAMLREGVAAPDVIKALVASDPHQARRQVAVVDAQGRAAVHTGAGCLREAGHYVGEGYSVQANMMLRPTVIEAMRQAYDATAGEELAVRMMTALRAAQEEGGDIRGMQSAALKVVSGEAAPSWRAIYDIRVDEHDRALDEMGRILRLYRAGLDNDAGFAALEAGDLAAALARWQDARTYAPEREEMAFWQAVRLADARPDALEHAILILREAIDDDPYREQWLELIRRLDEAGEFERPQTATQLLQAYPRESS